MLNVWSQFYDMSEHGYDFYDSYRPTKKKTLFEVKPNRLVIIILLHEYSLRTYCCLFGKKWFYYIEPKQLLPAWYYLQLEHNLCTKKNDYRNNKSKYYNRLIFPATCFTLLSTDVYDLDCRRISS